MKEQSNLRHVLSEVLRLNTVMSAGARELLLDQLTQEVENNSDSHRLLRELVDGLDAAFGVKLGPCRSARDAARAHIRKLQESSHD